MQERRWVFQFLWFQGLILIILFVGNSVGHAERLKVGPLEIHPYLQVSETYESNVFRCKEGGLALLGICPEESDFFTVVTPGIQILLPRKNQTYQVEYRGDFSFYTDFTSEEYSDHEITGEAEIHFTRQFQLLIKDKFTDGHDSREISPLKEIDKFMENRLETEIEIKPQPGAHVAAGFGYNLIDYDDKPATDFRDREDLAFSGRGKVRMVSNTSALVAYDFTSADYKDVKPASGDLNNITHEVQGGISYKVGNRAEGKVTGGYLVKMFDDTAKDDFSTGVFTIILDYSLLTETQLQIRAGREVKEPDWAGAHLYITTGGAVSVLQKLLPQWEGSAGASYGQDSYFENPVTPGRSRKDKTLRVKTGIDFFPFRWMTAGIQYVFSNTDSNWFADQFDFTNHAITFKVAAFY